MNKKIQDLRDTLFETIDLLKKGEIDSSQAKAITGIAQVIVDSAKVENEFLRDVNAASGTGFIGTASKREPLKLT